MTPLSVRSPSYPDMHSNPRFFSLTSPQELETILQYPGSLFLETGERHNIPALLAGIRAGSPNFALSVTTKTAYHSGFVSILVEALQQRFELRHAALMPVKTCLQEAISNAILHGNLGLESRYESLEIFESYMAEIEKRARSLPYQDLRVTVTACLQENELTLAVSDEGKGIPHAALKRTPALGDKTGHGLFIIRSLAHRVWIGKDSRCLHMMLTQQP